MLMNYYEILFNDEYGICIKGTRQPSIEEANVFCKSEVEKYGIEVMSVVPISHEEACQFYDMDKEDSFPIFQ